MHCTSRTTFLSLSTPDTPHLNLCLLNSSYLTNPYYVVSSTVLPPPTPQFFNLLSLHLNNSPPSKQNSLLLLGDFNVNYHQTAVNPLLHSLHSVEDKLGLKQIVALPTRPVSSTPIDHIYLSESLLQSPCDILSPCPALIIPPSFSL